MTTKFISNKSVPVQVKELELERLLKTVRPKDFITRIRMRFPAKVSDQALADLFDHLATLLTSGIPLIKGLELSASSTAEEALKKPLEGIAEKMRMGQSFSDALQDDSRIFGSVVRGMVQAGEASGRMDQVLRELADAFTRRAEMKSRVVQALAYPMVILAFGILTLAVLLTFVIPKLSVVFEIWDTPLPWTTRSLLALSKFMAGGGWVAVPVLAGLFFLIFQAISKKLGPGWWAKKIFKLPVVSRIFFLLNFTRLTRTWGMLLRSGVPILEALRASREVLSHPVLMESLDRIREASTRGARLQESIAEEESFPRLAKDFLSIGEETGTLDQSFNKIADFYDRELEKSLKFLTTLLEPAFILLIGIVIGALVISLLLPIFEMSLVVK